MTVKELIEILSKCNNNTTVLLGMKEDDKFKDIEHIVPGTIYHSSTGTPELFVKLY